MKAKGISLPELLVAITVAGVAGGLIINLLVSSNTVFFSQSVKVSQGLSLNQAAQEITSLIKSSAGISLQYPPTGPAQFVTGSQTLVLEISSVDQNGNIIDQHFDYIVISKDVSNPKILRKQIFVDNLSSRKAENKIFSTSLKEVKFNYLDSANLSVPPLEAVQVNFIINLSENTDFSENESSTSGTANLKN